MLNVITQPLKAQIGIDAEGSVSHVRKLAGNVMNWWINRAGKSEGRAKRFEVCCHRNVAQARLPSAFSAEYELCKPLEEKTRFLSAYYYILEVVK